MPGTAFYAGRTYLLLFLKKIGLMFLELLQIYHKKEAKMKHFLDGLANF